MAPWLSILISIAVKLGIPWLLKAFPWIPASVVAEVQALIDALTQQKLANKRARKEKIAAAKARIHAASGLKCM